jgi:hypothetical protein
VVAFSILITNIGDYLSPDVRTKDLRHPPPRNE